MSEVSDRYQKIAEGFTTRVENVSADAWTDPTPCSEWTVRDLVSHVIATHRRVLASVDGTEPVAVAVDAELLPQWRSARDAISGAVADRARATTMVGGMFGEQPFESLVGRLLCADTLIHTWDLARATHQDERLDAEAVAKSHAFLAPIDDAIRRPGGFAAKIEPAPGADEQTMLLNFSGREA